MSVRPAAMRRRYRAGLVVGKFAPLHAGHVLVIEQAQQQCEHLIVLSYSNPEFEGFSPERREAWLRACFPTAHVLMVTPERLEAWFAASDRPAVPANDSPDETQREFVAMLCLRVIGTPVEAVFTSEDYGEGFAQHLTRAYRRNDAAATQVEHVSVDRARKTVPISGTALRAHPWRHWHFLPRVVARDLVRRIAFLGGESSGKTSLAARMAQELGTRWVPEYGRELWEAKSGALDYRDLLAIATTQIDREDRAVETACGFVFCDTSPLTTLLYCLDLFGRAEPDLWHAAERRYDRIILCAPDFPFVQDGTRRDETFRQQQHRWYEKELALRGIPYSVVTGSIDERVRTVRSLLGA